MRLAGAACPAQDSAGAPAALHGVHAWSLLLGCGGLPCTASHEDSMLHVPSHGHDRVARAVPAACSVEIHRVEEQIKRRVAIGSFVSERKLVDELVR